MCFSKLNYASDVQLCEGTSPPGTWCGVTSDVLHNTNPQILSLNESLYLDPRPAPSSTIRTNNTHPSFAGAFLDDLWLEGGWTDLNLAHTKNATHSACGDLVEPTVWSGEVRVTCAVTVKSGLLIQPGTWIRR